MRTIYWGVRSIIEGPISALLHVSYLGDFQGVWCIRPYPHSIAPPLIVGLPFWPLVYPEIVEGFCSFLRASAILRGDPKFLENLRVSSMLSFPSDWGFIFPSRFLSLGCNFLLCYVWEVWYLTRFPLTMKASLRRLHFCFHIYFDSAEGGRLIGVMGGKLRLDLIFWFWLLTHHVTYWLFKVTYVPCHGYGLGAKYRRQIVGVNKVIKIKRLLLP